METYLSYRESLITSDYRNDKIENDIALDICNGTMCISSFPILLIVRAPGVIEGMNITTYAYSSWSDYCTYTMRIDHAAGLFITIADKVFAIATTLTAPITFKGLHFISTTGLSRSSCFGLPNWNGMKGAVPPIVSTTSLGTPSCLPNHLAAPFAATEVSNEAIPGFC